MTGGDDKHKKTATATISIQRPIKTISYTKTIPGEEKKKTITKGMGRKPKTSGGGVSIKRKKTIPSRTPDRTTSVHLKTMNPQPLVLKTEVESTPSPPTRKKPDNITEVHKERRRVRRLITARSGSGIGAKRGQSMSNKIQRTKDKVKRFFSPWMGGADYYATTESGKSFGISKEQYKALRNAKLGVRRPL